MCLDCKARNILSCEAQTQILSFWFKALLLLLGTRFSHLQPTPTYRLSLRVWVLSEGSVCALMKQCVLKGYVPSLQLIKAFTDRRGEMVLRDEIRWLTAEASFIYQLTEKEIQQPGQWTQCVRHKHRRADIRTAKPPQNQWPAEGLKQFLSRWHFYSNVFP